MNNAPLSDRLSPFKAAPADKVVRRRKLLIFSVGKLNMALPIESVYKILRHTAIHGSGTTPVGIAHIGNREMTVIDLYQRLFKVPSPSVRQQQFLIVASNSIGEQFGILVQTTPTLEDVPLSQIRLLPDSYRRADTLEIASHVTAIPKGEETLTAFAIDVDLLLPPI